MSFFVPIILHGLKVLRKTFMYCFFLKQCTTLHKANETKLIQTTNIYIGMIKLFPNNIDLIHSLTNLHSETESGIPCTANRHNTANY